MSVDRTALLRDLQRRVRTLEDDVRERLSSPDGAEQQAGLKAEHHRAIEVQRTGSSWPQFRDDQVTQSAVAWVLATVFVRFCEDNRLVPEPWIAGPGERTRLAAERQQAFLIANPILNDRDWLESGFDHVAGYPATAALLDHEHNPLYRAAISADAAEDLIDFWRRTDDDGNLVHDFTDPELSTRFLGDLYQDLSESARTKYALLQTPEFVEEFILDRTLEPALAERSLEGFRMIDPTCGSGHFLLGTFHRLFDRWSREAPRLDLRERVQRALDSVHGVDINPYAVAIARFRLTIAAMKVSEIDRLAEAPAYRFHLAVGDSLLHGVGQQTLAEDADLGDFAYSAEDLGQLQEILQDGRYDCVVGNPPYITVKDRALNHAYRDKYSTCKGTYALSVPFMQRFFGLAITGDTSVSRPAGWVGQITSNSFMKREFGSKLIEDFLTRIDLCLVADSSGAYIPGHGTPTVIIIGRNQGSIYGDVRAVLGIRGEPGRPDDPKNGLVWQSMVRHVDQPGWSDEWVTIANLPRSVLAHHPWTLTGGGAAELVATLQGTGTSVLSSTYPGPIGGSIRAGADEVFMRPLTWHSVTASVDSCLRKLLTGDVVRDWDATANSGILYPYEYGSRSVKDAGLTNELWPWRATLAERSTFSGKMADAGLTWWEYMQHTVAPYLTPLSIAFAFVATHNHFVLDRGGKVFNRSAPVIKLPEGATEDDHLGLLGVLNSSTACFWLKQNSHNKGSTVDSQGARQTQVPWENFYEFTGTTLQDYPLPEALPLEHARRLDQLARELSLAEPDAVFENAVPTAELLVQARSRAQALRAEMISEQEELDWEVYTSYGLQLEAVTYPDDDRPPLALGERAFEIALARKVKDGEAETAWFDRHGSTPITELPSDWPAAYRELVQRRLDLIESDQAIRLLESPEHKRRWASEPWEKRQERALRGWLLDRLESAEPWRDRAGRPQVRSITQLADQVSSDDDFLSVLELWAGQQGIDIATQLASLLAEEHVPFLGALRYKPAGLRKREQWETTWELQRAEDRGESVGTIPVPPKYTTADFVKTSYWRHRGKLDVPKERFISYPGAERGADRSLVLGWAGWDHAEQAQALASLEVSRAQQDGWQAEQLMPLLAGLAELEPWLHQWHTEVDRRMGMSPAQAMTSTLDGELARLGKTRAELAAWRPPAPVRGRRAAKSGG